MNQKEALDIIMKSLNTMIANNKHRNNYGLIDPSKISADIIVNGAIEVLKEIQRNILDLPNNRILIEYLNYRNETKNYENLVKIVNSFKFATLDAVEGLTLEDADYVEDEIYKLVSHNNVEEVIKNYYINVHGTNPFE
ncbi:hypothetical protein OBJ92_06390 [Empedobacter falsenii]